MYAVFLGSMSSKLPPPFIRSLQQNFAFETEPFIEAHIKGEQITSIRLNPYKPVESFENEESVPWCAYGKYLKERPSFTSDPLFHAGCYYVQEASSMFIEQAVKSSLDLTNDIRVLDLCAAPGGKSTLLSSLITDDSLLVSNEIIKTRVPVLSDNLTKWGPTNIVVSNNDPKDFRRLEGYFDLIVADAPCSGSGMFRKDPEAINEWSESAVQLCSQRQQRILADIYPALKEDGILIYSTCSYSKEENEDIADWLCNTFNLVTLQVPIESSWGIEETRSDIHQCYGYRFYPHKVKGEGFFMACFQKKDSADSPDFRKLKSVKINVKDLDILRNWIDPDKNLWLHTVNENYFAINPEHQQDLQLLQSNLYLKKSGTRIGKIMGKDLIPDHELALSLILNKDISRINLTRDEALTYLKRDELRLDTDIRGWALMCFQDQPLGWAKILQNRVNNYFPKEMRITNPNIV